MKTLGLIGGISWESTREYYRIINETIRQREGGVASAPLLIHSFNFAEIASLQHAEDWEALNAHMIAAARGLEAAGAQALVICSNYMHRCAPSLQAQVKVPLLHIADVLAKAILKNGHRRVGLLGAAGTMEHPFYQKALQERGVETLIPEAEQRAEISRIIYNELCAGQFTDTSRRIYCDIIEQLHTRGAEGVILGCTEIEQLVRQSDTAVTLYPTAALHAQAAAEFILS